VNPSAPDVVYAASLSGVSVSTDGCATFHSLHNPDQSGAHRIASAPSNPSVLYRFNTSRSASRSDDGGTTWTFLPVPPEWFVTKAAVDPHDAFSVWIAFSGGVRHSSDGGMTWTDVSGGLPAASGGAFTLAIDGTGSTIHVGLFRAGIWELKIPPPRRRSAVTR
jgi:hypothetical protein